jgi:hypothetical protein
VIYETGTAVRSKFFRKPKIHRSKSVFSYMGKRKRSARERRQWERMLRGAVVTLEPSPEFADGVFVDTGCPDEDCPVCQALRDSGATVIDGGFTPGLGSWTARALTGEQAAAVRRAMEPLNLLGRLAGRGLRNGSKTDA